MPSHRPSQHLDTASRAWRALAEEDRAEALRIVEQLQAIKHDIAARAEELGYARLCREAIPRCKGECCEVLFPRDLDHVDIFIAICLLTDEDRQMLSGHLAGQDGRGSRCFLLTKDGCVLSFQSRPIACTNAYPCFMTDAYWQFLQGKRQSTETLYRELRRILDAYTR